MSEFTLTESAENIPLRENVNGGEPKDLEAGVTLWKINNDHGWVCSDLGQWECHTWEQVSQNVDVRRIKEKQTQEETDLSNVEC